MGLSHGEAKRLKRRRVLVPPESYLERSFALWLKQTALPVPVQQFYFAEARSWRFDFAWPDRRVAVEIEGVTRAGGRHQRIEGFLSDAEKYETALLMGWRVYRVPDPWVANSQRHIWRPQVILTLAELLGAKL